MSDINELKELKKVMKEHIKARPYGYVIDGKTYTGEDLIKELDNDTEIGKKLIKIAVKNAIKRYSIQGVMKPHGDSK